MRAAGGQVTISGNVGRNLTVAGGQVELAPSAVVRGGLVAAGGNVDLSAPVTGAVKVAAGTLIVANRSGAISTPPWGHFVSPPGPTFRAP